MLKFLFCSLVLSCLSVMSFAQSAIRLSYPATEDQDVEMLIRLLDVKAVNARLQGPFKGEKSVLTKYEVDSTHVNISHDVSYKAA